MPPILIAAFAVVGGLAGLMLRPVVFCLSASTRQASPTNCPRCGREAASPDRTGGGLALARGRCPACGAPITPPPLSVELVLAAVFAILASQHIDLLALLAFCWLAALGGALALIDLASQRLPNVLSVPTYLGVVGLLSAQALVSHDGTSLVRALAAGFGLVLFFLMLAVASRGGVGMGDVKLAASIGTALAWISVDALVAGVLLGLLLAGAAGLVAIISGRLRWKQAFAFGPFLVTGAVIILAASQWVA